MRSAASFGQDNWDTPRWFVVQSLPHREFEADARLRAQSFRTFLPVLWKTIRHARQFRTTKTPLFPGYLFVELTLGRQRWRSVNGTIGVARMIMAGDAPKPAPRRVVEAIIAACDAEGIFQQHSDLSAGSQVRIVAGPLAGHTAILTTLSPTGRVRLLLEIMGSPVSVVTDRDVLAPVA